MTGFLYLLIFLATVIFLHKAHGQSNTNKPFVKISGEITKTLTLSAEDLAKMKRITVSIKSRDGKEHSYTGAPIQEIFGLAGVTTGKDLRGENLSKYVLVKCADGYEVVFSLAEMDSSFTDRKIILADSSDGKPLPAGRGSFQLVVPAEKKPARNCFQVTEFVIRFAQ